MKNLTVKLTLDNKEVEIDHNILEAIARNIPDKKKNKKVFEDLIGIPNWMVKEIIAQNTNISKKTIKMLLQENRHGIHTSLLRNKNTRKRLSYKDIVGIIKRDNPIHSEIIAGNIKDFKKIDTVKLSTLVSKSVEPNVKSILLNSWGKNLSVDILNKFACDDDISISKEAKRYLKHI